MSQYLFGGTGGGGGSGTVTAVNTTSPILGGTINVSGTISFDENADFNWGGSHNFSVALPTSGIVPTGPTEFTNLAYVQALVAGLSPRGAANLWTDGLLPAYTAAGAGVGKTLTMDSVGILTVDTVASVLDDIIGVKDQLNPIDHGLYKVIVEGTVGVAAVLERIATYDDSAEVKFGSFFGTSAGTQVGKVWIMISPDPIVVDTDPINFTFFFTGTSYTASAGIMIVGTDIEADLAINEGLTVAGGQLAVDYDNVSIGIAGGKLSFIGGSNDVVNDSSVVGVNVTAALNTLSTTTVQSVTGYYVNNTDPQNPIIIAPKNNFTGGPLPTIIDDSSNGYSVNSQWMVFSPGLQTPKLFICGDASVGAAVWRLSESGYTQTSIDPTASDDSTQGYYNGTFWLNNNTNVLFVCEDNTATSAQWTAVNTQTLQQVLTAGNTTSLSAIFSDGISTSITISPTQTILFDGTNTTTIEAGIHTISDGNTTILFDINATNGIKVSSPAGDATLLPSAFSLITPGGVSTISFDAALCKGTWAYTTSTFTIDAVGSAFTATNGTETSLITANGTAVFDVSMTTADVFLVNLNGKAGQDLTIQQVAAQDILIDPAAAGNVTLSNSVIINSGGIHATTGNDILIDSFDAEIKLTNAGAVIVTTGTDLDLQGVAADVLFPLGKINAGAWFTKNLFDDGTGADMNVTVNTAGAKLVFTTNDRDIEFHPGTTVSSFTGSINVANVTGVGATLLLYGTAGNSAEGSIDIGNSIVTRYKPGGTYDLTDGAGGAAYSVEGVPGGTQTFDPATITSMVFQGGLFISAT